MNRNIPAFCAALLAFAIMIAYLGGFSAASSTISLADDDTGSAKTIYLTFDDGPSDRVTPKILDILAEEDVKATFFIIGSQAETRKYLLEREIAEGHSVGIHSYSHNYGEIYSSPQNLLKDIDKCNEVIKKITGNYSAIYRFPGGSYGLPSKLIDAVSERGLKWVDWNASTRDAEIYGATPYQLYNAAISTSAQCNNIVLLAHDSTTKTATADALKDIIEHFKSEGYSFSTF